MKKLIVLFCLLATSAIKAQAPQFLNYQAIARNAAGTIVTTPIGIKFEILQGSASGTLVYEETHNITPSSAGVFTAAIGNGSIVMGSFPTINWANSPYFIRVSIDPTGGTSYSTVGTSQLLSVPYALYAETAGNASPTYSAGAGISISSGSIINTAPDQSVSISGPAVTGSYPNYTITTPGAPTASTGISIVSGTITNTAPDQTVTISGAIGTYPNFTVTPTPATSITATGSSILITGSNPNFTIVPTPSLTLIGNQLSIADGNTVTLPTGTTYTNGAGISLTSGTIITNTAPDQTVTVSSGTNVTVNGTYPNFTINATPTLSLATSVLSISGGNSVTLPSSPATTVTAGTNMIVNGTAPSYTVVTPTYSLNFSNSSTGTLNNGISSTAVSLPQPTLTLSGVNSSIISAGSNSITIPHYSAGNGLALSGTAPNFTLGSVSTGTSASWSTLGNTGTNPGVNFLGTTDAQDLVFRTSNSQRMRLFNATGNVGIGNITSATELLQVETGSNTAMSIISGTNSTLYFGNAGNHFLGAVRYDNTNNTMSFWTNNTADRIFIDPNGRVAIGSNSTVSELDVNGSLRLGTSRLFLGAVGGVNSGYTGIYEIGSSLRFAIGRAGAPANPPFASGGNSYDAMTIESPSGNVGIGTTSPSQNLHLFVSGNNLGMAIEAAVAGRARLGILPGGVDNAEFGYRNHLTFGTVANSGLIMTNEWMRLTSTGNLGLGTTNPLAKLDISGGLTYFRPNSGDLSKILVQDNIGTAMRLYTDASAGTPYDFVLGTYPNGHINQLFLKQSNGFVGVRNSNPASPLDVTGETQTDSLMISGPGIAAINSVLVSRDNLGNAKWAPAINFKGSFAPSTPIAISTAVQTNIGNTLGGYTSSTLFNNSPAGGLAFLSTGVRYTVPETGVYFLDASIMVAINSSATGNNYVALEIFNSTTGVVLQRVMQSNPDNAITMNHVLHCSTTYSLAKNDIIILRVSGSTATAGTISNAFPQTDKMNSFSGFIIR